jgi:hypothetical protein
MENAAGMFPGDADQFLGALTGLQRLRVSNDSACLRIPPMKCLSALQGLQVRRYE